MSFKYKFTVFTPTYNRAHTIHRVYNSLKKQSLKIVDNELIFEWLIVDDGSNDNTIKIIEQWQKEADFPIRYFYQKNRGKIHAMRLGIENAQGELFFIVDSDDAFVAETIEIFYNIWNSFDMSIKEKCVSIVCLSQRQDGEVVGANYPQDREFIKSLDYTFKLDKSNIGENCGVLKTNYLKEFYTLPKVIDEIKFIPESFFWTKMALNMKHLDTMSYMINDRLRIYYIENNGTNLSTDVRTKYSKGFEYESLYFLNNNQIVQLKYSPKFFIKHLIKYIFTTSYNRKSILKSLLQIDNMFVKCLYVVFLPVLVFKQMYFK